MGEVSPDKLVPAPEQLSLSERTAYWQRQLDDLPPDPSSLGVREVINSATHDLDSRAEFLGALCLFNGYGWTATHPAAEDYRVQHFAGRYGISSGFKVLLLSDKWRLTYSFYTADASSDDSEAPLYYLAADSHSSLTPLGEVETTGDEIAEAALGVHEVLSRLSDDVAHYLYGEVFLESSVEEQRAYIRQVHHEVGTETEARGGITGKRLQAECERAYVLESGPAGLQYCEKDTSDIILSGECLGAIVLIEHRLECGEPVRTADDLIDAEAGLCLVVSPDASTRSNLALDKKQLLYLPISGQNLGVSLAGDNPIDSYKNQEGA